jgi:hypothetical protein
MIAVVWHLTGGRVIVKAGEGIQQVFTLLSPQDRMSITMNLIKVSELTPYEGGRLSRNMKCLFRSPFHPDSKENREWEEGYQDVLDDEKLKSR